MPPRPSTTAGGVLSLREIEEVHVVTTSLVGESAVTEVEGLNQSAFKLSHMDVEADRDNLEFIQGEVEYRILRYGREELLSIWEECDNSEEQWSQVLAAMRPELVEELNEMQALTDTSFSRRRIKNSERKQRSKAKRDALFASSLNATDQALGDIINDNIYGDYDVSNPNSQKVVDYHGGKSHGRKKGSSKYRNYDEESEEEKESFQPQAFAVEGEPDFESGPPQDGWEYLRRVIWEAARCPKVVVAEIDAEKLSSEQTSYMPEIPSIAPCPPDLLPSKDWEQNILTDFTQLRMELSKIHLLLDPSEQHLPSIRNRAAWETICFGSVTSTQEEEVKHIELIGSCEQPVCPSESEADYLETECISGAHDCDVEPVEHEVDLTSTRLTSCGTSPVCTMLLESEADYVSDAELGKSSEASLQLVGMPDLEDLDLPEACMESMTGLEVYNSSRNNILLDDSEDDLNNEISEPLVELLTKVFRVDRVQHLPVMSLLLRLDEVSRAALFRYHVAWLDSVDGLPAERALWLLGLSAVVDTPLNAETSAAFRAMLRYCAGIRALKQLQDTEELYLLNVLITVAGLYFKQAEANL